MKKLLTLFLLVSLGAGFSSCWPFESLSPSPTPVLVNSSPELATPQPAQACELLPKSEIEVIVGEAVTEPKQSPLKTDQGISHQGCIYLAASGSFTPALQLDIAYVPFSDQQLLEIFWAASESAELDNPRYLPVEGLGTRAYFSSQKLNVQLENYVVTVTVSMPDPTTNRQISLELAQQIIANWPEN